MHKKTLSIVLLSTLFFGGCIPIKNPIQQKVEEKAVDTAVDAMLQDVQDPIIRKHLSAQFKKTEYKIVSQSSAKDVGTTIMLVQTNGTTAKFRTTTTDAKGKVSNDMIVDGDTTYILDVKDNVWWKQTASKEKTETNGIAEKFAPEDIKKQFEENKTKTTYTSLGKEACGDFACFKYKEVIGEGKEMVRTIWFDDKDYLLRKDESTFGEFTSTNTYLYTDIVISTPSPTKDVPEGKSAYEMMYAPPLPAVPTTKKDVGAAAGKTTTPSDEEIQKLMEQYGQGEKQ